MPEMTAESYDACMATMIQHEGPYTSTNRMTDQTSSQNRDGRLQYRAARLEWRVEAGGSLSGGDQEERRRRGRGRSEGKM